MDNEIIIGTVMIDRVIYTASVIKGTNVHKLTVKDDKGGQVTDEELVRLICQRIFDLIL